MIGFYSPLPKEVAMETLRSFAAIEVAIHDLAMALHDVSRWRHYRETKQRETVLAHSWKGAILAQVMIGLEQGFGRQDFDAYRILAAATVHDIGEGAVGDVRYEIKLDPRIRAVLEEYERDGFARFVSRLPPAVHGKILKSYALQDDRTSFEGKFFNALERLGYMFWAVREFLDGNTIYREVFQNQHKHLLAYMDEFACVRFLYGPLVPEIDRILAESAGMERTVPVPHDDRTSAKS